MLNQLEKLRLVDTTYVIQVLSYFILFEVVSLNADIIWLYSLASVIVVSLISLIGVIVFYLIKDSSKNVILYFVSFSAGGLFADSFIHLIPEAIEKSGSNTHATSLSIIFGIIVPFILERFLQWRHCHIPTSMDHPHSFAYMNLFGDAVHNFIDGLVIGGSYFANIPLGVATTLAVIFHEIPQEIGDFGVLLYGGLSKKKAVFLNFSTALTSIFGAVLALTMGSIIHDFNPLLISFAAGNFIYIAGSDLIPEIRKDEPESVKSILQLAAFVAGVLILLSLTFLE